jgi:hypothetical protein
VNDVLGGGPICHQPTVVVQAFKGPGALVSREMPLVRADTGWIGLSQIR